ncbi:GNAT family N-acetyltransferase [Leifsonia shinshuensis]|uniref:Putative GNAT family acetyltransferase n=1 Tax=Leifsonia shinshuensis TaxID=150026 RepID=A0A853CZF6_9MICO|nr:GNAT family N-acetyltransferase [Leifsonia shinshuensis]NYJ25967.1 putative GNAT family acetyltransferase [Leifsonia shinshuensis]
MAENSPENEYPDEAGYPDGRGFLSEDQRELVREVDSTHQLGIDFYVVNNADTHTYEAISGDTLIGGITYAEQGDAITLLSTNVFPEYRNQGVASELIKRVLDELRSDGRYYLVQCPTIRAYIERHPEYRPD